ncbi:PspC domain-containing protein [Crossiella sp. CA-258035]|uniref:ATP-binding protein n=1 Tax=Crossiella sp. CA-258035 TaxID=2981138 RepID=UPI0024BCD86E|nr:ATP-binding protein [Crossiella sp. CA-258035]WHT23741.1 PspC domain-containing protein [Crossiella sp. CA-258035]
MALPLRMYRRRSGRILAGVAGGLAEHLKVNVLWVRVAFTVLVAFAGAGVLAYGLLWLLVPQRTGAEPQTENPVQRQQAIGVLAIGVAMALALSMWSGAISGWVVGPLGVALAGAALVWREADEAQRRRWRDSAKSGMLGRGGRMAMLRVVAGILVATAGVVFYLVSSVDLNQAQLAVMAVVVTLLGVGVLTVPWWLRLVRDLNEERRARIRTEERAEIAAHLHDSVLQTLALILKQADNPREVSRLARGQERQLRSWLYGPAGYGRGAAAAETEEPAHGVSGESLADAVGIACGQVEDTFAIRVQQVVVGDCPLDDRMAALVQAAREAAVNAAKHAGVGEVSVYAEVEPEVVYVFVRDRGAGFDPEQVPADRHGLADSIHGRMERNGGKVRVRTAPGEGTEIQLEMPRASKEART